MNLKMVLNTKIDDDQTDAATYLKEASALIGLLFVVYVWSLVAMALQA